MQRPRFEPSTAATFPSEAPPQPGPGPRVQRLRELGAVVAVERRAAQRARRRRHGVTFGCSSRETRASQSPDDRVGRLGRGDAGHDPPEVRGQGQQEP